MRRQPIYLLIDTSESMRGEPLDAVHMGVKHLVSELRSDPHASEAACLSVISFGSTAQQVVPLTELAIFETPQLEGAGASSLGAALEVLLACADRELKKTTVDIKGDFKPLVFIMTDGQPTDSWVQSVDKIKRKRWNVIACSPGPGADEALMKHITESVVKLYDYKAGTLTAPLRCCDIDGPIRTQSAVLQDPSIEVLSLPPLPTNICLGDTDEKLNTSHGKQIKKAILTDGREVEYVFDPDKVMEGGMMQFFFTPDRSSVVCYFKDQSDPTKRARLEAVVGKFNPTTGPHGEYWKKYFCWPTGIIQAPRLGYICPAHPSNYYFKEGPFNGQVKNASWFMGKTSGGKPFRDLMPPSERGTWINHFRASLILARILRRLHSFGMACSSLGPGDIYLDPSTGSVYLYRIEDLVIPSLFPPDVIGTPGYIAPEVLATYHLPIKDPNRKHPCIGTDLYALAVLIYQFLLFRHPLKGPKVNSNKSAEEDDLLSLGSKALFIEHPTDRSNRPPDKDLKPTYDALGPHLVALFNQAFIDGLHSPDRRPIASAWERAFQKTWDLLHPCANPACTHKWFVAWQKGHQTCSFCGTKVAGTVLKLNFHKEARPGTWLPDGELVVYNGIPIMKWHVFDNITPNETLSDAERTEILADCQLYNGKWLLINRKVGHMVSPAGNPIPPNSAIELKPGVQFRLSTEPHGRMVEVELVQQGDI